MTRREAGAIAEAIARYLQQHPDAADSVEGIQRWWLGPEFHDESLEAVCEALDMLEAGRVVICAVVEGGRVIYRSARSRPLPDRP